MMYKNISKELDWIMHWKNTQLKELRGKEECPDYEELVYKIIHKYETDRNQVLVKYGITIPDATI